MPFSRLFTINTQRYLSKQVFTAKDVWYTFSFVQNRELYIQFFHDQSATMNSVLTLINRMINSIKNNDMLKPTLAYRSITLTMKRYTWYVKVLLLCLGYAVHMTGFPSIRWLKIWVKVHTMLYIQQNISTFI